MLTQQMHLKIDKVRLFFQARKRSCKIEKRLPNTTSKFGVCYSLDATIQRSLFPSCTLFCPSLSKEGNLAMTHPDWAQRRAHCDQEEAKNKMMYQMYGDNCVDASALDAWKAQYHWACCGAVGYATKTCGDPTAVAPSVRDIDAWRGNPEVLARWEALDPDLGKCNGRCTIRDEPIPNFKECYRQNVMNTTIPAGSRAGSRPCGSLWKSSQRVYCFKCFVRSQLESGISPDKVEW